MSIDQETTVIRWGGISGLVGGIVFVASIVYQVAFIGTGQPVPDRGRSCDSRGSRRRSSWARLYSWWARFFWYLSSWPSTGHSEARASPRPSSALASASSVSRCLR